MPTNTYRGVGGTALAIGNRTLLRGSLGSLKGCEKIKWAGKTDMKIQARRREDFTKVSKHGRRRSERGRGEGGDERVKFLVGSEETRDHANSTRTKESKKKTGKGARNESPEAID